MATLKKPKVAPAKGKLARPLFEGLDGTGLPYTRQARSIGELPLPDRTAALESATAAIAATTGLEATKSIAFGAPVFTAFKDMHRAWAKNHPHAKILLATGDALGLELVPLYE